MLRHESGSNMWSPGMHIVNWSHLEGVFVGRYLCPLIMIKMLYNELRIAADYYELNRLFIHYWSQFTFKFWVILFCTWHYFHDVVSYHLSCSAKTCLKTPILLTDFCQNAVCTKRGFLVSLTFLCFYFAARTLALSEWMHTIQKTWKMM